MNLACHFTGQTRCAGGSTEGAIRKAPDALRGDDVMISLQEAHPKWKICRFSMIFTSRPLLDPLIPSTCAKLRRWFLFRRWKRWGLGFGFERSMSGARRSGLRMLEASKKQTVWTRENQSSSDQKFCDHETPHQTSHTPKNSSNLNNQRSFFILLLYKHPTYISPWTVGPLKQPPKDQKHIPHPRKPIENPENP